MLSNSPGTTIRAPLSLYSVRDAVGDIACELRSDGIAEVSSSEACTAEEQGVAFRNPLEGEGQKGVSESGGGVGLLG